MSLLTVKVSYMMMFKKVQVRPERYNTNSLTVLIDDAVEIQIRRRESIKMNQ